MEDVENYIKAHNLPEVAAARMRDRMALMPNVDQWMSKQLYLAFGFALAAAAEAKIASCPMEGFDVNVFKRVLKLEEKKLNPQVLLALGKESADPKAIPYRRYRSGNVISHL